MKTGFFSIAAVSLLQLAVSQPHVRRHQHHQHQNRELEVVTNLEYKTVDTPVQIVVYVDGHGKPFTTKTIYHQEAPPTEAPASPRVKAPAPAPYHPPEPKPQPAPYHAPNPKPKPHHKHHPKPKPAPYQAPKPIPTPKSQPAPPPQYPKPAPAKPAPAKPAPPAHHAAPKKSPPVAKPAPNIPPTSKSGPGFGSGVSYSPYNADNSCKSAAQVAQDFGLISGYSVIRLYGTDCDQVENVLAATKGKGVSLFLGIFDINQVPSECEKISKAIKGDWHLVNTISVGNELVNNGKASCDQVTAAISQARGALKAAGYTGPVVTVDTMVAMKNNPQLCHASDYCAINCHAFFDGNVLPDGAGDFVKMWVQMVSDAAGGKEVVITETGWPSQGDPIGKAIPSKANQEAALASIRKTLSSNVIQYNAFNDLWKAGTEKYWGILGDAPSHS